MYLSLIYLTYHIFAASPVLLSRQDSYADLENAVACENVALCFSFFWDTWRVLNRQVTGSGSVQGHEVWWVPPCMPSLPSHGLLAWTVPHNLSHMSISVLVPSGFLEPRYSPSGRLGRQKLPLCTYVFSLLWSFVLWRPLSTCSPSSLLWPHTRYLGVSHHIPVVTDIVLTLPLKGQLLQPVLPAI